MKLVLISIRPKWCELIANGEKTIEVRKTKPKLDTPFKCYIYCTIGKSPKDILMLSEYNNGEYFGDYKANGKVIGEFVCDDIDEYSVHNDMLYCMKNSQANKLSRTCLTVAEIQTYFGEKNIGYGWHISNLKIYDKPKELSEFKEACINKDNFPLACKGDSGRCEHLYKDCHNGCYSVTRPPQSWGYVEGVTEND